MRPNLEFYMQFKNNGITKYLKKIFFTLRAFFCLWNFHSVPIIIINYNQLDGLRDLITFLTERKFKNIIVIDNKSDYPPLLEYYQQISNQIEICYCKSNEGHMVLWNRKDLYDKYCTDYFVMTDPDILPQKNIPYNFLRFLKVLLDHYKVTKVGLSLRIDDIDLSIFRNKNVILHETQFWENEIMPNIYLAPIDTTFALYAKTAITRENFYEGIRVAGKFTARHGGWYVDPKNLTSEQEYYLQTANISSTLKNELNEGSK